MSDQTTRLIELRQAMRDFVRQRNWEQFHSPKNLAMALSVEAAELLEHFLWIDGEASRRVTEDPAQLEAIADEIADVFGGCLCLCNVLNLDLSDILRRKMAKNAVKYPIEANRRGESPG